MEKSEANSAPCPDDESQQQRNDGLLCNGGKLSANQTADDNELLPSDVSSDTAIERAAAHATECSKQHGVWCRVKAFSLSRSDRQGRVEVENDQKDNKRVSRLTRLKRLRKRHGRANGRAFHFLRAGSELRSRTCDLEVQIQRLQEINEVLMQDTKKRETDIGNLQRKLYVAEKHLTSGQRQSAKLHGLLELAKLQAVAQQQVLDEKQDDIIKQAVKQAELYDQIRKLKLTIESLRSKLEKFEDEKKASGNEDRPQDEGAEHPSNLPLPASSTAQTMTRLQAAIDARRTAARPGDRRDYSDGVSDHDALNHLLNNFRNSMAEAQRKYRRNQKRALVRANRLSARQKKMNNALRASIRNKDSRIRDLSSEKEHINVILQHVRNLAIIKIEVLYKNLVGLPDEIQEATSPLNIRKSIKAHMEDIDRSASFEEATKILSKMKEFGRFLASERTFEEFMKNESAPSTDSNRTNETNSKMDEGQTQQRRILRRQRVNNSIIKARRHADLRTSGGKTPAMEKKDCKILGKGGKHCRCCCYEAKLKKRGSLSGIHQIDGKVGFPLATVEGKFVAKSTQETNTGEIVEPASKDVSDEIECGVEVEGTSTRGAIDVQEAPEEQSCTNDDKSDSSDSKEDEQAPPGAPKCADGNDELRQHTSTAIPKSPKEDLPEKQNPASMSTSTGLKLSPELWSDEDAERQRQIISKVSDLLVDKWCLEGQVKALEDNERELTEAKSEISFQLDAAYRQLASSSSDIGRHHPSHNVLALEERLDKMQMQLKEMEEKRGDDETTKLQLQCELEESKKRVCKLEQIKERLECEVAGWMETVLEVRRGRINLLNHMEDVRNKDCRKKQLLMDDSRTIRNHDAITISALQADIETLAAQRKIQDSQIGKLTDLLQQANEEKHQLMVHLSETQQERYNLQRDMDEIITRV